MWVRARRRISAARRAVRTAFAQERPARRGAPFGPSGLRPSDPRFRSYCRITRTSGRGARPCVGSVPELVPRENASAPTFRVLCPIAVRAKGTELKSSELKSQYSSEARSLPGNYPRMFVFDVAATELFSRRVAGMHHPLGCDRTVGMFFRSRRRKNEVGVRWVRDERRTNVRKCDLPPECYFTRVLC